MESIIERRIDDRSRKGYITNELYPTDDTALYHYESHCNKVSSYYPDPKTKKLVESETFIVPV